jgi:hypothetical protein
LFGRQIGFPVGALHDSKLAAPVPTVSTGANPVFVDAAVDLLVAVSVASPVGTATWRVVPLPLIVVSTRPAVAPLAELLAVDVVAPFVAAEVDVASTASISINWDP